MKGKTIKIVLRKKIGAWLDSIDDEKVQSLAKANTIVTGGAIASMLLGEKVIDFDVYFRNHETVLAVANYYVSKFNAGKTKRGYVEDIDGRVRVIVKSAGIAGEGTNPEDYRFFEQDLDPTNTDAAAYVDAAQEVAAELEAKPLYRPIYVSTNAITLAGQIQLVLRFYGGADDIHKNYDYIHCTNSWDIKTGKLTLRPAALESLLAKELRYMGSLYPLCSVIRTRKFLKRGWTINAGQYLKMAMQISALDLTDLSVLEDQLIGVDTAYFDEVVRLLKEKTAEGKPIDNAYLIEIIDRMF